MSTRTRRPSFSKPLTLPYGSFPHSLPKYDNALIVIQHDVARQSRHKRSISSTYQITHTHTSFVYSSWRRGHGCHCGQSHCCICGIQAIALHPCMMLKLLWKILAGLLEGFEIGLYLRSILNMYSAFFPAQAPCNLKFPRFVINKCVFASMLHMSVADCFSRHCSRESN